MIVHHQAAGGRPRHCSFVYDVDRLHGRVVLKAFDRLILSGYDSIEHGVLDLHISYFLAENVELSESVIFGRSSVGRDLLFRHCRHEVDFAGIEVLAVQHYNVVLVVGKSDAALLRFLPGLVQCSVEELRAGADERFVNGDPFSFGADQDGDDVSRNANEPQVRFCRSAYDGITYLGASSALPRGSSAILVTERRILGEVCLSEEERATKGVNLMQPTFDQ